LKIKNQFAGHKIRQYAMALSVLDGAIEDIYVALGEKDMLKNTYFIFASDNGGCFDGGAQNGDLRGSSGTLFEGGVKVESFVYSPMMTDDLKGMKYDNLFHVTDWFPTILSMTGISYEPVSGYELDGVSHWDSMIKGSSSPRDFILYNSYTNVEGEEWDIWASGGFAIRNKKYKLLHSYESKYSTWYNSSSIVEDDDVLDEIGTCSQSNSMNGVYTYYLFDLVNDPNETINLYESSTASVEAAKTVLYDKYSSFKIKTKAFLESNEEESTAIWKLSDGYIVPWTNLDSTNSKGVMLKNCGHLQDADVDGPDIDITVDINVFENDVVEEVLESVEDKR
jgi:arylsulfatase A-like enzyme